LVNRQRIWLKSDCSVYNDGFEVFGTTPDLAIFIQNLLARIKNKIRM